MNALKTILLNWAPLFIVCGAWFFVMRRVKSQVNFRLGKAKAGVLPVCVTVEMQKFVEESIAPGEYMTASDVVSDGLRLLRRNKAAHDERVAALRNEAGIGAALKSRGDTP